MVTESRRFEKRRPNRLPGVFDFGSWRIYVKQDPRFNFKDLTP